MLGGTKVTVTGTGFPTEADSIKVTTTIKYTGESKGAPMTLPGSKFFHFHAVFGKNFAK